MINSKSNLFTIPGSAIQALLLLAKKKMIKKRE